MKIGILINVRTGSKRLPDKHFRFFAGQMALEHLVDRLTPVGEVYIAGAHCPWHFGFNQIARTKFIHVRSGDTHNIPLRHLWIAQGCKLDAIVSVDGDDLLTSPTAVRDTIKALEQGKELVRTEGLPLGMNVLWGYTTKMLRQCATEGKNDTGWGKIFPQPHLIRYEIPHAHKVKVTLDYPEDLSLFQRIFEDCPPETLEDDVRLTEWIADHTWI